MGCCNPLFLCIHVGAGELTTPTLSEYDLDVHLCINDVAVDDLKSLSVLHMTLKQ